MQTLLKSAQRFFSFVRKKCEHKHVDLNRKNIERNKNDQHRSDTDSKKTLITNNHDHTRHQEHNENKHEPVNHSEITVSYRFFCNSNTALKPVVIHLFDHFPGVEKINAMWVTETGQGVELLSLNRSSMLLR